MSRFLLVTNDTAYDRHFRAAIEGRIPGDVQTVFNVALPGTPDELLGRSIGEVPSVVLMGPGVDHGAAMRLAGIFDIQRPEVSLVLIAPANQDLIVNAMRAGFQDVLDLQAVPETIFSMLSRALNTADSRRRRSADPNGAKTSTGSGSALSAKSRVIVVTSPKGGVGKTTVAANLAVGLGKIAPMDTVLVDLDVQFGDVSAVLRLNPEHTLNDAVVGPATLDALVLKTFLTVHPASIYALCSPADPAAGDSITGAQITHLLEQLTDQFKYVVVDTTPGMGEHMLAALEAATDAVFVAGMDVPGVRAMRKQIDLLNTLGIMPRGVDGKNGVKVVVNTAERQTGLSVADIEQTIKTPVDIVVPRDKMAVYATNRGEPLLMLAPKNRAAKPLQSLVATFDPTYQEPRSGAHRKAMA